MGVGGGGFDEAWMGDESWSGSGGNVYLLDVDGGCRRWYVVGDGVGGIAVAGGGRAVHVSDGGRVGKAVSDDW